MPILTTDTAVTKFSTEGGFGGGQLGFNVQRDRVVFGLEADIQGAVSPARDTR